MNLDELKLMSSISYFEWVIEWIQFSQMNQLTLAESGESSGELFGQIHFFQSKYIGFSLKKLGLYMVLNHRNLRATLMGFNKQGGFFCVG